MIRQFTEDELRQMENERTSVQRRLTALEASTGTKRGDNAADETTAENYKALGARVDDLERAVTQLQGVVDLDDATPVGSQRDLTRSPADITNNPAPPYPTPISGEDRVSPPDANNTPAPPPF